MRDEIDARIWVDHHDRFADSRGGQLAAAGTALRGLRGGTRRAADQLLSLVAAIGITLVSFGGSVA